MEGFKNNKENQIFNSLDVLSILLCFFMVVAVTLGLFKIHSEQQKAEIAKNYVEKLARELIKQPVIASLENHDRLPASVDSELDPWGEPYKKVVVRNTYGQPIYLVVLSGGPKKKILSHIPDTLSFTDSQIENLQIDKTDIGKITAYR